MIDKSGRKVNFFKIEYNIEREVNLTDKLPEEIWSGGGVSIILLHYYQNEKIYILV